jgi:hypothetical protein
MGLSRIVHMQIDLLHDIGDVGSCEGQVLESPCNALKLESLLNRRPGVYSELRLEVDRSRARLTISHGRTLDDVQRVSALVEVVKRPEVVHREFPL